MVIYLNKYNYGEEYLDIINFYNLSYSALLTYNKPRVGNYIS